MSTEPPFGPPWTSVGPQRNSPGTRAGHPPKAGPLIKGGEGWRFCGMLGVGESCGNAQASMELRSGGGGSLSPQKALRAEGRAAQVRRPRERAGGPEPLRCQAETVGPTRSRNREGQGGWRWRAARPILR